MVLTGILDCQQIVLLAGLLGAGEIRLGLGEPLAYDLLRPVIGALSGIELVFRHVEFFHPLVPDVVNQGDDVILPGAVVGIQVYPGGNQVDPFQVYGIIGVFGEGDAEQHAVLSVRGGHIADVAQTLVGNRIAHGIENDRLVLRVNGALQQVHRLNDVGMTADDDVNPHIAKLLGNGLLLLSGIGDVFHTPVHIDHRGFGPGGFHLVQIALHFTVEGGQILIGEVVADPGLGNRCVAVELGSALGIYAGGVGVAEHTHFDTVDILNGPFLLVGGEVGAQGLLPGSPDHFQGALIAYQGGVIAVIVGSEQHIKAGVLCGIRQGIGAVEVGVARIAVAVVCTCEGGFQVDYGEVRSGYIVGSIFEDAVEIIAAVLLQTRIEDGLVHDQIAGGENGGCGDHMLRLRHGGGRGLGFLCGGDGGFCGGFRGLHGGAGAA